MSTLRIVALSSLPFATVLLSASAAAQTVTEVADSSGDGVGGTLDYPSGLFVDSAGTVFVTGLLSANALRIEDPCDSQITTELIDSSGDGGGNALSFANGIARDAAGNAYVAGQATANVFRIAPSGAVTELMDATGDGAGNTLATPAWVAIDATGSIYVSGFSSNNVFKIEDPSGAASVQEIIDSTGDGAGNALAGAFHLAVDDAGTVYVTGANSDNVFQIVDPCGARIVTEILDATGDGLGNPLDGPTSVAVDSQGNVYVTGSESWNAFKVTDPGGANTVTEIIDSAGDSNGNFLVDARGVAVDSLGSVFVAGADSDNVFRIADPGGVNLITEIIDSAGAGLGQELDGPHTLAVDALDRVFVSGTQSDNVLKYEPCGLQAEAASRNPGGVNPASYTCTPPVRGSTFTGTVDLAGTTGHPFALLLGYSASTTLTLGSGDVLLIDLLDPSGELLGQAPTPGPVAVFAEPVPGDVALCGFQVFTQAAHFGGGQPFALSNAQDLVVGR